jgi:hypothetical protein
MERPEKAMTSTCVVFLFLLHFLLKFFFFFFFFFFLLSSFFSITSLSLALSDRRQSKRAISLSSDFPSFDNLRGLEDHTRSLFLSLLFSLFPFFCFCFWSRLVQLNIILPPKKGGGETLRFLSLRQASSALPLFLFCFKKLNKHMSRCARTKEMYHQSFPRLERHTCPTLAS